jgi:cobalamin biosynthesis protein CobT
MAREPNIITLDKPVGALKTQLSKLLLSVDRVGWNTGATAGRFDVRRTSRLLAGSERVFKERFEVEAVTTAVSIIIDLSGSMTTTESYGRQDKWVDGTRIGVASQCAYAIASAVERSNCNVEVTGFRECMNSDSMFIGKSDGMAGVGGTTQTFKGSKGCRMSDVVNVKAFDQRVGPRRKAFELLYHAISGGTPDYHGVRTVVEDMSRRPEQRKVVIVVTDGVGEGQAMKQLCQQSEKLFGVTVLGLGVQTSQWEMQGSYTKFACVNDINELTDVAIRQLIDQIKSGKDAKVEEAA